MEEEVEQEKGEEQMILCTATGHLTISPNKGGGFKQGHLLWGAQ